MIFFSIETVKLTLSDLTADWPFAESSIILISQMWHWPQNKYEKFAEFHTIVLKQNRLAHDLNNIQIKRVILSLPQVIVPPFWLQPSLGLQPSVGLLKLQPSLHLQQEDLGDPFRTPLILPLNLWNHHSLLHPQQFWDSLKLLWSQHHIPNIQESWPQLGHHIQSRSPLFQLPREHLSAPLCQKHGKGRYGLGRSWKVQGRVTRYSRGPEVGIGDTREEKEGGGCGMAQCDL